jgi:hypothetical protein
MTKPENVLFLHIPKTAGTSLKHYLFHRYSVEQCLLDPPPRVIDDADFNAYALVGGHLDYDYAGRYRRPPLILTCLRNPVARALSAYNYSRASRLQVEIRSTAQYIGEPAVLQILDELHRLIDCADLPEFLRREPQLAQKNLGNVQARFLAGATAAETYAHEPRRLLAVAKKNLETCSAILFNERMSESIAQLDLLLGHDEFGEVTHDNVTPAQTDAARPDPELTAALNELCNLDLELYSFAEQLWQERMRSARVAPAKPAHADSPLPDAANFTFDQPIRGRGWHIREHGAEGWYCWSGEEARLYLALNTTGPHVLRLWIDHAASEQALHGLEACVNGIPLSFVPAAAGRRWLVEALVPPEAITAGRVCIEFHVPHTLRPSDGDPLNPDTRRLGVALSRLKLQPHGAEVHTSL